MLQRGPAAVCSASAQEGTAPWGIQAQQEKRDPQDSKAVMATSERRALLEKEEPLGQWESKARRDASVPKGLREPEDSVEKRVKSGKMGLMD